MPPIRLVLPALRLPHRQPLPLPRALPPPRSSFHTQPRLRHPRKDAQDKDSILVEPNEYSKSGSDTAAAQQDQAAFDPSHTSPEESLEKAGQDKPAEGNPLEASPANREISKPRGGTEGGAENSSASSGNTSDRQRSSGGGSPEKGSKVS